MRPSGDICRGVTCTLREPGSSIWAALWKARSNVSSLSSRKFRQRKSLANSARLRAIGASLGSVCSAPLVAAMARTVMRTREPWGAVPASGELSAASTASAANTALIAPPPGRRRRPRSPWSDRTAAPRLRGSRSRSLRRWSRRSRRRAGDPGAGRCAAARAARPRPAKPPPPGPRPRRCCPGAPSRSPRPTPAGAAPRRAGGRGPRAPARRPPSGTGPRPRPCAPPPPAPRPSAPRARPCAWCSRRSPPRARRATRGPPRAAHHPSTARSGGPTPRSAALFLVLRLVLRLVSQVLAQLPLHLQPRVEEPAHHRPLADAQRPGQLFIAQAIHLAQQQDGAMVLRERGEGLLDLPLQLRVERGPVRARQRRRGRVHAGLDLRVALVQLHPLAPSPLARRIQAQIGRDPIRPGEEGRVALERGQVAVHPDERLLGDVHRLVRVSHHPQRQLVDAPLVPLHQSPEGLRVAALRGPNERPVVRRTCAPLGRLPALGHRTRPIELLFMRTTFAARLPARRRGGNGCPYGCPSADVSGMVARTSTRPQTWREWLPVRLPVCRRGGNVRPTSLSRLRCF